MELTKKEINDLIESKMRKDFNYIYKDMQTIRTMIADLESEFSRLRRKIEAWRKEKR